jgi:hypothetical protein
MIFVACGQRIEVLQWHQYPVAEIGELELARSVTVAFKPLSLLNIVS